MSQMPEQVLLHKDEKYNAGDYYTAYNPLYIAMEELDGTEKRSDYIAYIPNYRIKELLNKACAWLKQKSLSEDEVAAFRKEMQADSLANVNWDIWDE